MITITLDKNQSRILLDMIHVAEWVYNAHLAPDESNKEVEKCLNTVNRQCYEQGWKDLFYQEKDNDIALKPDDLEACIEIVNAYTEDRFWDHLAEYLAERDLSEQFSETELKNMGNDTYFEHIMSIQDRYFEEFEKNGVDNLIIGSSLPGFLKEM